MNRRFAQVSILVLALASALYAGCAQERDPINRVQPDALDKHFFVGASLSDTADDPEFYWRNFVVDASASQSLVGVGSWGAVDRVRWEITETLLLARKAYQIANGEDAHGSTWSKTNNGTVVAAYKITSHFDIRRDYNPQTGEELNIVVENTTDRPWYQRDFMRVDWSMNLVDDPMWQDVFTGKVLGDLTITPVAYYMNDPANDDAPHLDAAAGYLDVTNKFYVAPAQSASPFLDLPGKAPTCMLVGIYTGSSTYECDAQEATVRASYWKIDPNHDFEPLENTHATLDVIGNPGGIGNSWAVGVVGAGRQGWDPQYGFTDPLYHRFAYIHNLWKKSHLATSCADNADNDHDGTADQCSRDVTGYQGNDGSQCDVFVNKCTIPVRDRELKPVAYWINKDAPGELLDPVDSGGNKTGRGALEDLVYSWNQMMQVAVAFGREVECRRTGGARDDCHAQYFTSTADPKTKQMLSYGGWLLDVPSDTTPVLTFCHNPVRAYDLHDVCGKTGDTARVGDVRKNFIFYWPYESRAPWGGIANWNADPLTGEILGAAATIMGRSATFAGAQERDIIQIAMGDLKLGDIIDGAPADTYSHTLQNGYAPKALSQQEIDARIQAVNLDALKTSMGVTTVPANRVQAEMLAKANSVSDPTLVSTALLEFNALARQLTGSVYEAQLVDQHWLVNAVGANPNTRLDDSVMDTVSPLRGLDIGKMEAFQSLVTQGLRNKGVCYLDGDAPAVGSIYLPSLAGWFKAKYANLDPVARGNAMYLDLWKEAVKGIGLHEIGHSLGMLHQFASSWDSLNYNPQYWQLRTNEGRATQACAAPRAGNTDTCMGPRYVDPETADELGQAAEPRPAIDYFANTSTMEYQIERGGETVGLGTYDLHTMKALYGRVLETFDDRVVPTSKQQYFKFKLWSQLIERDILDDNLGLRFAHYTDTARVAQVFDPKRDCRPATDEEKATAMWRIVHGEVCATQPKDHWRWDDFVSGPLIAGDPDFVAPYWHALDNAKKDRVRWPYRWGVNHNAYFHTNDSDAGADPYEVVVNTVRRYDATYPWTHFRRQNREYYYTRIPSQVADRFYERIRSYHWMVATDLARSTSAKQLDDDNDLRPYVMGEKEMFTMLAKSLLMPEPGDYFSPDQNGDVLARQPVDTLKKIFDTTGTTGSKQAAFSLGIVDARYIGEEYDNDLGGSWDYLNWIKHAGFTVEKARAVEALVDGRPTLFTIARANFLDGRNVKINFRNDLPDAIDRLVGGVLSEDWETIGAFTTAGSSSPEMLDLSGAVPIRPAGAQILFPNVGYKQELATAMFAALFSRLNTDMTLVNKMRVWIDGQVGAINVPPDQQIKFTDPNSGYTYIARIYGDQTIDGKTVDKGIASRMLAHANALQKANRTAELRQYVGLIDAVREIGQRLGYGPLGGPNGD